MEISFTKNLDLNTLESNSLQKYWAPFLARWAPFRNKKSHRKNVKFHLTRA